MKKLSISVSILVIFIIALTAYGNYKYKSEEGSQLVKEDISSKETAEKSFEENYDLKKLTDEEKLDNENLKKEEEEANKKIREYIEAKDKVQDNLNNNLKNKHDGYIVKSEVIDSDGLKEKISIDINVKTVESITTGQIETITNEVLEEVDKVIESKVLEIKLRLNDSDEERYAFTSVKEWGKNIEP